MVVLFLPFSALDKLLNFKQAVAQCAKAIRLRALATVLIVMALGVEVVMSLAIVTGIADRLAAFILAGYCIVTALLWKPFWKASDFRFKGESGGREIFWDFLKKLGFARGVPGAALGAHARGGEGV